MMRPTLPCVVLVVFATVPMAHLECRLSCDEVTVSRTQPSCHGAPTPARGVSDPHSCADHAPQAAIAAGRMTPLAYAAVHSESTLMPPALRHVCSRHVTDMAVSNSDPPRGFRVPLKI